MDSARTRTQGPSHRAHLPPAARCPVRTHPVQPGADHAPRSRAAHRRFCTRLPAHRHRGAARLLARSIALRRGWPFTTAYHSRFPEYVKARCGVPLAWSYALLRRSANAATFTLAPTPAIAADLAARGFRGARLHARRRPAALQSGGRRDEVDQRPVYVGRIAIEKQVDEFLRSTCPARSGSPAKGRSACALADQIPAGALARRARRRGAGAALPFGRRAGLPQRHRHFRSGDGRSDGLWNAGRCFSGTWPIDRRRRRRRRARHRFTPGLPASRWRCRARRCAGTPSSSPGRPPPSRCWRPCRPSRATGARRLPTRLRSWRASRVRRGRCSATTRAAPRAAFRRAPGGRRSCATIRSFPSASPVQRSPERPERIPALVEELFKMPIDDFLQIEYPRRR